MWFVAEEFLLQLVYPLRAGHFENPKQYSCYPVNQIELPFIFILSFWLHENFVCFDKNVSTSWNAIVKPAETAARWECL